jgi:hypothetical protein
MFRLAFLVLCAVEIAHAADFDDLDCKVRALAYEYGQKLQGTRGNDKMKLIHDSLQLETRCNNTFVHTGVDTPRTASFPLPTTGRVLFVDPFTGSDAIGNIQSASPTIDESKAFLTIQAALDAVASDRIERAMDTSSVSEHVTIVLREGVHRPSSTLEINAEHSFTTIMNYPGEESVVSGAKSLKTEWKPYKVSNDSKLTVLQGHSNVHGLHPDNITLRIVGEFDNYQGCEKACADDATCRAFTWHDGNVGKQYKNQCWVHFTDTYITTAENDHVAGQKGKGMNIYVADLTGQMVTNITGLRVGGQRGQRASYPDRNPELTIFPDGWVHDATTWKKPGRAIDL